MASRSFLPHGFCYLWNKQLLTLHVVSDSLIFLSYLAISYTIAHLWYHERRQLPFQWIFVAFGLFIVACGFTHAMDVVVLWIPLYWMAGDIKFITAIASITTAIAFPMLVPKIRLILKQSASSRVNELRFVAAAESSMDCLYFCEAVRDAMGEIEDFVFTYANNNAVNFVSYSREQLIGSRICELFPGYIRLGIVDRYKDVVRTGAPFVGEFEIGGKHIHTQWLRIQAVKLGDGVAVSASDISGRKQQEESLRKSEALLNRTERLAKTGGWEVDLVTTEVFWSDEVYRIYGLALDYRPTVDAVIEFCIPEDRRRIKAAIETAIAGGEGWDLECTIVTAEGNLTSVRAVGTAEFENGKPVRLTGSVKDISERVAERRAMEAVTQRLRLATDSGGIGIWDWDIVHNNLSWDHWMYRLYNVEPCEDKAVYDAWRRRVHTEDVDRVERELQDVIEGLSPLNTEFRIIRDDGQVCFIHGTGQITRDAAGRGVRMVGTNRDVTAEKQSELELARLASFREAIISSSPFATIVTDLGGVITAFNPAAERMLLYQGEDLIHLETPLVLLCSEQVSSRAIVLSEELQTRIEPGIEVLAANPRRGKLDEAHWQMIRRDGTRFEAQLTVTALTDAMNEVIGYVLIAYDITERQQVENRTLRALAEKDVLLKEVHHRVKNNLQVICSLLNMQAGCANDAKTEEALMDSQNRVHSMAMIHEMLYNSEKLSDIKFEEYILTLAGELLNSFKIEAGRVRLSCNVFPMRLQISRAVPCGLILNELISNSLKYAFPENRTGEIHVSLVPSGEDHCEIIVEDTGVGLPEGFSVDRSKSLGLRIVDVLVKQLGGEYFFSSNNGTRFRMDFPLNGRDPSDADSAPSL
jgi:PAS domain S-box-containing protein